MFDVDKLLNAAIKKIWDGKITTGDIDQDLFLAAAQAVWEGIQSGWGLPLSSAELDAGDKDLQRLLRENAYVFAAFKSYNNVRDMAGALVDENGLFVDFATFEQAAREIGETYYRPWLQAEFTTAQASGQASANWREVERNADVLPMLEYKAVKDSRVREAHEDLDGVVMPFDSPFWDSFYPPNGWRCRCDVVQTVKALNMPTAIPDDKGVPPVFRNNPGKTGKAFNDSHPYFAVPPADAAKVRQEAQKEIDKLNPDK